MSAVARLHPQLQKVLLPAYAPCPAFAGVCRSMRWAPARGHVPRGFSGATGALKEVQLVLVTAEPGDPHPREQHLAQGTPAERLTSAYRYATECLRSGKDLFHRSLRHFLALCWPHDTFDQHLRKTWLTDAVLCSAAREGGYVRRAVECECRTRYLESQLALFPGVAIVAIGKKAKRRLAGIPGVVFARSVAPPDCNYRGVKESWAAAARAVHRRVG